MHWYEWAFSGIGVVVLGFVGNLSTRKRRSQATDLRQMTQEIYHNPSSGDAWKITEPAPSQLIREVNEALPFDERDAGKRYVGLPIIWEGRLVSIEKDWGEKYRVSAVVDESCNLMPFLVKNISPAMKTPTRNSTLIAKGKVESVSNFGVRLQDNPEVRLIRRA